MIYLIAFCTMINAVCSLILITRNPIGPQEVVVMTSLLSFNVLVLVVNI
jgi:hypothetical protein